MQKNPDHIELLEDKAIAEKLFSSDAFEGFENSAKSVPADYFNHFETKVLGEINQLKKVKPLFSIPKWGQIAIAASFFTIVAATFIFIESNKKDNGSGYAVTLNDITTAEIDAYVSENEELAEIDWQSEINKEEKNLETIATHLIQDTNISQ